jgi:beta-galactosidase
MKEMGCDAIRTAHNPPASEVLDVCDEMGVLVLDEAFDCWNRHKFPADFATHFDEWHSKEFTDFVKRDRNHPSVVMWSIGNEISDTYEMPRPEGAIRVGHELTRIAHYLDPTRPTTMGHCRSWAMTNGMARTTDVFGANYLNGDYAWYLKNGEGPKGLIATETCSAVSTRGEGDLHVFRKNNCLPEVEFAAQAANPACYGEFVWTGFDYLGEPDPFSKQGARSSYYGIVDLCGFPKERYWTYRKHWRPDAPGIPEERISASGKVAKLEQTSERFRDLVYVKIRALDSEGAFVAKASQRLRFKASGPWKIVGVCNGDPMDYDSLKGDTIRLFNGLAQVVLQLDGESESGCKLDVEAGL